MSPANIELHNRNEVYTFGLIGITLNFSRKVLVKILPFFFYNMYDESNDYQ